MFNYFGNAYLFEKNIKTIYKQLRSPNEIIIDKILVKKNIPNEVEEGIYILTEPKEYIVYCVVIKPILDKITSTVAIFIPGPGAAAWESYLKLGKGEYFGPLKFKAVLQVDCLNDSTWIMGYFLIYNFLLNKNK